MKFAVIGAGSWGTVLANHLSNRGHGVTLWCREPEAAEGIVREHRNPLFQPGIALNPALAATTTLRDAVEGSDVLLFAVPSAHLRGILREISPFLTSRQGILNAGKGLEIDSGKRLSEVFLETLGVESGAPEDRIACLSGPNLAGEIGAGKAAATVIACPDKSFAQALQAAFAAPNFRVYSHTDRIGVELGGALKNIFAIGAGIVDALELGENAKAAYMTRSLHEMVRLGTRMGGKPATFYGLSGLGDLMATASSPLSRNHQLGVAVLKGKTREKLAAETHMVYEGVETARMAREWGKRLTIPLPITEEICRVLFDCLPPTEAALNLMTRSLKAEEE